VIYGVHSISGQLARNLMINADTSGAACYALVIIIGVPTVLVYSESTARMGPSARAMDSVPCHSNLILGSRICGLRSCRDVKFRSMTSAVRSADRP
jgi:hypothetical protein